MADNKKPDPQFPERSGGSLLKASLAASPLAVGTAVALKGIASDGSLKQPRESGIDQAMHHLASKNRKPYIPSPDEVSRFMGLQSGDISKQAWQSATQSLDSFSKSRMLKFTKGLEHMSEAEVRSSISQTMRNESVAMSRVWRKFQSASWTLLNQVSLTGNLPVFKNVSDMSIFARQRTIPMATTMPEAYMNRVSRIAQTLDASMHIRGVTRPEVASAGFGVWNVGFRGADIGDFSIQIPQVAGGVMLEGGELQTRRIASDIVHVGVDNQITRMSRPEFFLKELEESVLPDIGTRLKTERDVDQAIRQLKGKIFGELEVTPNVLPTGMTAAQAQREALRGMSVDVVMEEQKRRGSLQYRQGWRKPESDEISKLMLTPEGRAMGLRGGVSPSRIAEGGLSTVDWEKFYVGVVDEGRRPEQKIREFQATETTLEMLGQRGKRDVFRAADMGSEVAYANVARPQIRVAYVNPGAVNPATGKSILEELALGEGEAAGRKSTIGRMTFEESKTAKLAAAREDIMNFESFKAGESLGTRESGKIFTLPKGAKITNVRPSTDTTVQVEYMQQHKFRHGDKMFDAAKAVVHLRQGKEIDKVAKGLGIEGHVDLIASMDEIRKNKSLHKSQILNELTAMVTGTWDAQAANRAWNAASNSHEVWIRNAMKTAVQELDFTPREFGQVFGATGYVLGKSQEEMGGFVAKALNVSDEFSMRSAAPFWKSLDVNAAVGMGGIAYGGPRLEAGVMGSLEPRAFDILQGGAFGGVGKELSADFVQRLAVTSPEAVIAHKEIGRTLRSMAGEDVAKGAKPFIQGQSFQKFLEKGGGVIQPGKGLADVYVPGADIMQSLRPFETASGVTARGKVSDIYHDLAYKAGLLTEGEISASEFKKESDLAADMLRREFAPGGKGIGSVTRGKMIGSRFLRGVSAMEGGASTAISDAYTVGITKGQFENMYQELAGSKLYSAEMKQLENMKSRFLAGQDVGGMLSRHPFIGEFSLQPTNVRMVEGADDLIVLPELKQNIRVKAALEGEFREKTLTLGPLIGLAGDKDADSYSLALVSPRTEEKIRKQMLAQDSEFTNRYAQHQVRMQLFKPGRAREGAELVPLKQMMADVEKLGVGQKWIAPLSVEMTAAKQALTTFGQGQAAADARFLLEWLEQTPISAKHMSAEEAAEGGLQSLMMGLTRSFKDREQEGLIGSIESIVKDDAVAKKMLTGNVYLDKGSAKELSQVVRSKIGTELSGLNVTQATGELMRVLGEADTTGATDFNQMLAGRGSRAKMSQIAELAANGVFRAKGGGPGVFNKVSTAATEASNLLGRVGRGMIRHHKTIGFGFAGSIALASVLSDPPETVGPGKQKIPDGRLLMNKTKAANRLKPEDLHPASPPVGQPTAPQLVRNQTVRMKMNESRPNMRVQASVPADTNISTITGQLGSMGGNLNVNLRDSRSMLQPHEIANKLL
jgi:hypothetical protein